MVDQTDLSNHLSERDCETECWQWVIYCWFSNPGENICPTDADMCRIIENGVAQIDQECIEKSFRRLTENETQEITMEEGTLKKKIIFFQRRKTLNNSQNL